MIINKDVEMKLYLPNTGETLKVMQIPTDFRKLEIGCYYPVGEYVYKYIGRIDRFRDSGPGTISMLQNRLFIRDYEEDDDTKDYYHIMHVQDKSAIDEDDNVDHLIMSYAKNYRTGNNVVKNNRQKIVNTNGVFIPELYSTDDALTRIMKQMIIHKKLVPSECRATFKTDYSFDNMRSALTGATANMTITKFLAWCDLLNCKWQFTVEDNGTDTMNPLHEVLQITSEENLTCDFGEVEKGIFKVPLSDKDDPLKRLIKVAIIKKHLNINEYKHRGSTPYLLNNMRSALKGTSKLMLPYFTYWCEILGLNFTLRVIDPEDGTYYQSDVNYNADDYDINDNL